MTAASQPLLASQAPAKPAHLRRRGTLLGNALVAVLLTLGCVSVGGAPIAVETAQMTGSIVPSAVHEVPVPVARESSLRRRFDVVRRRCKRAPARLARFDGARRFAHWLPVQFRLMPPVWRGPTVLRL